MNLGGLLGGRMGEVVVECDGLLPDEVFETIKRHGGRISRFSPLTIVSPEAAELTLALAGILGRAEAPVNAIRLRRSRSELATRPASVA